MSDEKKINLKALKIGLLGDTTVGKTAICNSLLNIEFNQDMLSTIGSDKLETKFSLENGKEIKLIIFDIAGGERFRSTALQVLREKHGFILVFDVTKKSSFENIKIWLKQAKDNLEGPCVALFGNKADFSKDKREVTTEEANEFAKQNNLKYFETSAKTNQCINEGFSYVVNEVYKIVEAKMASENKPPNEESKNLTLPKKNKNKKNCQ